MPATTEPVPGVEPLGFDFPYGFDIHDPLTLVAHSCEIRALDRSPAWPSCSAPVLRVRKIERISPFAYAAIFGASSELLADALADSCTSQSMLWQGLRRGLTFADGCDWDLLDCAIYGMRSDLIEHWQPNAVDAEEEPRLKRRLDECLEAAVDAYAECAGAERSIPVDDLELSRLNSSKAMTIVRLVQAGATGGPRFWSQRVVVSHPGPGGIKADWDTVQREDLFRLTGMSSGGRIGLVDVAAWGLRGDQARPTVLRSLQQQGLRFDDQRLLRLAAQLCDDRLYFVLLDLGINQGDYGADVRDFLQDLTGAMEGMRAGSARRNDMQAFLAAVQASKSQDRIAAIRAAASRSRPLGLHDGRLLTA